MWLPTDCCLSCVLCHCCSLTPVVSRRGFIPRPFYETCNQEVYAGSLTPPLYDFSKVTAPMYMFLGELQSPSDLVGPM